MKEVFNAPLGNPPAIQFCGIDQLQVDDSYQRSTDTRASTDLILSMARDWDWRLCLPLLVSNRLGGGLFVIDGQHRLAAAKMRGDIAHLPACITGFANAAEEAAMFVAANRRRKAMSKFDDHRAAVAAGNPKACQIDGMVRDAQLQIASSASPASWQAGDVGFIAPIATHLRTMGAPVVSAALTIMGEAFGAQVMTHGSTLFGALCIIFKRDREIDSDELLGLLLSRTAAEWCAHPEVVVERAGTARHEGLRRLILSEIGG